jgi:acyl dehydratase
MSMDLSWIGREFGPNPIVWSSDQCMLYALGVGAGVEEPQLTTENSEGVTLRALLDAVCDGDPARFGSMEARFARPAYPGDTLVTEVWSGEDGAFFETKNQHGESLIERGVFALAKSRG